MKKTRFFAILALIIISLFVSCDDGKICDHLYFFDGNTASCIYCKHELKAPYILKGDGFYKEVACEVKHNTVTLDTDESGTFILFTDGQDVEINIPNAMVKHYGTAGDVDVKTPDNYCLVEGDVETLFPERFALESASIIKENIDASIEKKIGNSSADVILREGGIAVNIPQDTVVEDTTVILSIKEKDEAEVIGDPVSNTVKSYEISLKNKADENIIIEAVDSFFSVKMNIGSNIDLLNVYHVNTPMTKASGNEPHANNEYVYDKEAGILWFKVTSFSPFSLEYKYSGGLGTEKNPYLISNVHDLNAIVDEESLYFKLTTDLTCDDDDTFLTPLKDSNLSKGDTCYSLIGSLKNCVFDGDNHTIKFETGNIGNKKNADGQETYYRNIFSEVYDGSVIKNLTVDASGYFSGIVRWAKNTTLTNINLKGNILWDYKNLGAFVHYYHYNVGFDNCNSYADITNYASAGSAYCSVFVGTCTSGYYSGEMTSGQIKLVFNNCNNYGNLTSNQAGMFIANGPYTTSGQYVDVVINNSKNFGIINNLGGTYTSKSNFITADTWDKAYALRVSYDNGRTYLTGSTETKWYDKTYQDSIIGEGGLFLDSTNSLITFVINANKTISVDASAVANVDHIVLHVTMNSSKVCDITETLDGSSGTSTIKAYQFVPQKWVDARTGSVTTSKLGDFDIVTFESITYYVTKNEVTINDPSTGTISAMALDSEGKILCSSKYNP